MGRPIKSEYRVRLEVLAAQMRSAAPDGRGPTVGQIIDARHPDPADRARVVGWFETLVPSAPGSGSVCCESHAAELVWCWFKNETWTLDQIEVDTRTC